jgi:hypothetical protein
MRHPVNQRSIVSALSLSLALSLSALGVAGCSSDDSNDTAPTFACGNKGPCSNDPQPSASQVSACEGLRIDTECGAAFTAYSTCAFSSSQCTAAGQSDPNADSTSSACSASFTAYTTCLGGKQNDAGTGN